MNNETLDRVIKVAREYASHETRFAYCTVVSVDKASVQKREHDQWFAVKLAMSHSPEQIESLIADSHPDEIALVRNFLKGDFVLNLIVAGDVVVAKEWENLDLS
ncbi:MAG: hypothetical protein ACO1RA_08555 [Planctomycetaceae bacterium]